MTVKWLSPKWMGECKYTHFKGDVIEIWLLLYDTFVDNACERRNKMWKQILDEMESRGLYS